MLKASAFAVMLMSSVALAQSSDQRALDAAVMSAISRGDIGYARSLATTEKHWLWIQQAAQGGQQPKTRADVRAEMGRSQECKDAQRSYQLEAGRFKQDRRAIEAARSNAAAACGSYRY